MDAPEGQQSIEALDLVIGAQEHAGDDARQRKIIWADGKRQSIEHSTDRIHTEHPGVPRHLIETHVLGWLENCAPESYSERQLEELDRLIGPWLRDYERRHEPQENSRELGTLEDWSIAFKSRPSNVSSPAKNGVHASALSSHRSQRASNSSSTASESCHRVTLCGGSKTSRQRDAATAKTERACAK